MATVHVKQVISCRNCMLDTVSRRRQVSGGGCASGVSESGIKHAVCLCLSCYGYIGARTDKTQQSGQTPDEEVELTLRLLMSYIYIYIYIYIYMKHLFLMFLEHTQRRSTVGRNPLDE